MSALEKIYKERNSFIILGLTGRTGSGCSEVAKLLSRKEFSQFNPPIPKHSEFENDEERKYRIAYDFLEHNWQRFYRVRMSHIVATFLLESSFEEFINLYKQANGIAEELSPRFMEMKPTYDELVIKRRAAKKHVQDNPGNIYAKEHFDFYFAELPKHVERLRKIMDLALPGSFTRFFQLAGNNARKSGNAYLSEFDQEKIYMFSQRARMFVKMVRHKAKNTNANERVFIVIDAIRNPYEVQFFRERYSNFYLLAVSTKNSMRKGRLLQEQGMSNDDINSLDHTESPIKHKGEDCFWSLDVARCIEVADIHLSNPDDNCRLKLIKESLVKYLSLMMHPGLITPSKDERCMHVALGAKLNSGCISRQVGAVVTDFEGSIKAVGWNNVPQGQTPCNLRRASDLLKHRDEGAFSEYEKEDIEFHMTMHEVYKDAPPTESGKPISFCFKDIKNSIDSEKNQVHTRALHAEENAFLQISKHGGMSLNDGILYTTASPCELCAKKAYQLGINKVVYIDPYPGISNSHIFRSGSRTPDTKLFYGAVGRAYQQLFDPIMPYKNELALEYGYEPPNRKKLIQARNLDLQEENEMLQNRIKELENIIKSHSNSY